MFSEVATIAITFSQRISSRQENNPEHETRLYGSLTAPVGWSKKYSADRMVARAARNVCCGLGPRLYHAGESVPWLIV
jgi:hypothetical protein